MTLQNILEVTFFIYLWHFAIEQLTNLYLHGEDILNMDCGCIDLRACILVYVQ